MGAGKTHTLFGHRSSSAAAGGMCGRILSAMYAAHLSARADMSNAWQLCSCVRGRVSGREGMGLETLLESTIARSRPRSCCDNSVGSKTNTNNNSTTTVNPTGVGRRANADR